MAEGGGISTYIGTRGAATVLAVVALATGALLAPVITGGGGGDTVTCNQTAANSSQLSSALSAASNGQTVCLTAATTYSIPDTTKAVTIISQSGTGAKDPVNNSVSLDIRSSDANWTLDGGMTSWGSGWTFGANDVVTAGPGTGLTITGALIRDSPSNITIRNFKSTGCGSPSSPTHGCRVWTSDPSPLNANITIERGVFYNIHSGEAALYFDDNSAPGCGDSGITIRDSYFVSLVNDGIKLSGCDRVHVVDNKFYKMHCTLAGWTLSQCNADAPGTNHTDSIQYIADNHEILGNWVKDSEQCIFGDDDSGGNLIEGNVLDDCTSHWITIAADSPTSTVKFNTIAQTTGDFIPPQIDCGGTDASTPVSTTIITDNVAQRVSTAGSPTCVPTTNTRNMCISSCGAGNFTGTPDYAGYDAHASIAAFDDFADFCLKPTSTGYSSGLGGAQVGACGPNYGVTYDGAPSGGF